MAKKKAEEKAVKAIERAVKKAVQKGVPQKAVDAAVDRAIESGAEHKKAAGKKDLKEPKPGKSAKKKTAPARKSVVALD